MSSNGQASPLITPLERDECMALLAAASLGRVGTTIDAMPVVLPVTFSLHNDAIVFRTMPDTKLHEATLNAVIAFQVDSYVHAHEPSGWSVLVQGPTARITDPATLGAVSRLPLGPWAPDGTYVALTPTLVSGRRVVQ